MGLRLKCYEDWNDGYIRLVMLLHEALCGLKHVRVVFDNGLERWMKWKAFNRKASRCMFAELIILRKFGTITVYRKGAGIMDEVKKTYSLKPIKSSQQSVSHSDGNHKKNKRKLKSLVPYIEKTKWDICIKNPFQNCNKINPIQQRKVRHIIDSLQGDRNVEKIIIFGSSVTDRCHAGSDVDFYVQLKEDRKLHINVCQFLYDTWTNFTVDKRMLEEITKKGVAVYERNIAGQSDQEL